MVATIFLWFYGYGFLCMVFMVFYSFLCFFFICIFYGFHMVSRMAIWLLIKSLNMVASLVMVAKVLSFLVFQFSFNAMCLVASFFSLMVMQFSVLFSSLKFLGKFGYSLLIFLQLMSLLGISKPGKQ